MGLLVVPQSQMTVTSALSGCRGLECIHGWNSGSFSKMLSFGICLYLRLLGSRLWTRLRRLRTMKSLVGNMSALTKLIFSEHFQGYTEYLLDSGTTSKVFLAKRRWGTAPIHLASLAHGTVRTSRCLSRFFTTAQSTLPKNILLARLVTKL